jgi:hypothetical protein
MKKFVSIAFLFSWLLAQQDVITLPRGDSAAKVDPDFTRIVSTPTLAV